MENVHTVLANEMHMLDMSNSPWKGASHVLREGKNSAESNQNQSGVTKDVDMAEIGGKAGGSSSTANMLLCADDVAIKEDEMGVAAKEMTSATKRTLDEVAVEPDEEERKRRMMIQWSNAKSVQNANIAMQKRAIRAETDLKISEIKRAPFEKTKAAN